MDSGRQKDIGSIQTTKDQWVNENEARQSWQQNQKYLYCIKHNTNR